STRRRSSFAAPAATTMSSVSENANRRLGRLRWSDISPSEGRVERPHLEKLHDQSSQCTGNSWARLRNPQGRLQLGSALQPVCLEAFAEEQSAMLVSPARPRRGRLRFVSQRKRKDRVAGDDRDLLAAVDRVADRGRLNLRAELHVPQVLAGVGIERDEVALTVAREHKAARG